MRCDAVARLQPVELAFDATALLRHDAGADDQHGAPLGEQVQARPLVGEQHRIAQRESWPCTRARGARDWCAPAMPASSVIDSMRGLPSSESPTQTDWKTSDSSAISAIRSISSGRGDAKQDAAVGQGQAESHAPKL